jgi:hypothetical protein
VSTFLSVSRNTPLLVLRATDVIAKPPLCRRGIPFGAGIALPPSKSCLVSVLLLLGVAKSSSLPSSRSIWETLCECPCPCEAPKFPPMLDLGRLDSASEDCE